MWNRDFRASAVSATQRLGIRDAAQVLASTRSCCVELPALQRHSLDRLRLKAVALLLLSGASAIVGISYLVAMVLGWVPWTPADISRGAGGIVAAILLPWIGLGMERRLARAIAASRPVGDAFAEPETVSLEPQETYNRFKLVADDVGVLYHDRAGQRLLIDGTSHRYLICAPDVLALESAHARLGNGVRMTVRIGQDSLPLVVSSRKLVPQDALADTDHGVDLGEHHARRFGRTLGIAADVEAATS